MPTKWDAVDLAVLSLVGTLWLLVPAHLEEVHRPFSAVASASLIEMPLVIAAAFLWCFVLRTRIGAGARALAPERSGRLLFFAFMAYFWSLIDDGPVDFDSVLTWPEVTGGLQHIFLEVLLHALTLGFLWLALWEALKGSEVSAGRRLRVAALGLGSFWASYFQNTPFLALGNLPSGSWYPLDAAEHLVAVALLCLALRESARARGSLTN